jgi:hypothetical protein
MNDSKYKDAFRDGYDAALNDIANRKYQERLQQANLDPTGQDLDDFVADYTEGDDYSHIECPIQEAELRFGC